MSFIDHVRQIVAKDLRVEWRTKEIIYTMVLFSVLLVVIFSFAFIEDDGAPRADIAGGILWVAVAFSGTLGLGRVFEREREDETITALLMTPVSRAAIYTAKLVGTLIYMLITEAVVVPLLILLFGLKIGSGGLFVAVLLSGTIGFAAVGSLFAAGLMRARSRDVLLGILTYPLAMPVIVAGAKGTAALLASPAEPAAALLWLKLQGAFDVIFVVLSLWAFGPLVAES